MRSAALTLALLIILSGAAPAAALVPDGVDGGRESAAATGFVAQTGTETRPELDQPATEIHIQLQPDTDARWTITYRYALRSETEVAAFRSLSREYEAGRTDLGPDVSVFRTVAGQASRSTGRSMQIRDVDRSAVVQRNETADATADTDAGTGTGTGAEAQAGAGEGTATTAPTTTDGPLRNTTGVLRLSFTWTNFLERTDDGRLELGDVFVTADGGTWLSSLGEDQRLVVGTPPGFAVDRTSFPIQQQNGSLVIDGPREFSSDERLSVTYRPNDRAEIPWDLIVTGSVAVVIVLALVGWFALRGRSRRESAPEGPALTNGGETVSPETGEAAAPTSEPDGTTGESASSTTATGADADGAETAADEPTEEPTDEEPDLDLLSDEERVEYLLEQRGGRMKQANIVKETGWSDAKVSQLLSSMADEGRVEKLRLGRENLISLPDETVVDDPHDAGRDRE